jgi:beta-lactamase class C
MKTLFFKSVGSLLLLVSSVTIQAQSANSPPPNSLDERIKMAVANYRQTENVPGVAIAVFHNGQISFYNDGVLNKETRTPVTKETIFELGSLTKVFTATLMAELIDNKKMALEAPVTDYVKVGGVMDKVKMVELGTHTSGLPATPPHLSFKQYPSYTRADLFKFYASWRPKYPIGTHYLYSNIGFGLIGYALEGPTHTSYEHLVKNRIFRPLGMRNSSLNVPTNATNYAQGYNPKGQPVMHWPKSAWPAGGSIRSTSQDMVRFLAANLGSDKSGASPQLIKAMRLTHQKYYQTKGSMAMGLAWQLFPNGIHNKFGGTLGFNSYIALLPGKNSGVVVLTNRAHSNPNKIGNKILLMLPQ